MYLQDSFRSPWLPPTISWGIICPIWEGTEDPSDYIPYASFETLGNDTEPNVTSFPTSSKVTHPGPPSSCVAEQRHPWDVWTFVALQSCSFWTPPSLEWQTRCKRWPGAVCSVHTDLSLPWHSFPPHSGPITPTHHVLSPLAEEAKAQMSCDLWLDKFQQHIPKSDVSSTPLILNSMMFRA